MSDIMLTVFGEQAMKLRAAFTGDEDGGQADAVVICDSVEGFPRATIYLKVPGENDC